MKVSGHHSANSKNAVSFNTLDRSDEKIDNLTTMMGKLTVKVDKIDKQDTQFKPQIYQGKRRGQPRHEYNNENNYQIRNTFFSRDRRYRGRLRQNYGLNFR